MFYAKSAFQKTTQKKFKKMKKNNRGQILVEYLLLLVISVACATLLTKKLISRGDTPGIIINQWDRILKVIGNDLPDCAKQTDFSQKANCPP